MHSLAVICKGMQILQEFSFKTFTFIWQDITCILSVSEGGKFVCKTGNIHSPLFR